MCMLFRGRTCSENKRIKSNKISKVDKANRIKANKKGQKVYYKLNLTTVQMQQHSRALNLRSFVPFFCLFEVAGLLSFDSCTYSIEVVLRESYAIPIHSSHILQTTTMYIVVTLQYFQYQIEYCRTWVPLLQHTPSS